MTLTIDDLTNVPNITTGFPKLEKPVTIGEIAPSCAKLPVSLDFEAPTYVFGFIRDGENQSYLITAGTPNPQSEQVVQTPLSQIAGYKHVELFERPYGN